ncbi:ERF family protein [Oceanicaulis sp.]|uniref:ERF family protein n=1 Tax=Oceanicaulis sp. TaxID=1924941 RepID=UPI003D2925F8
MSAEPKTEIATREQYEAPAPANGGALTPMDMLSRAVDSGANIDVMEKLLALQERWEANQGKKAFDNAISEAKAKLPTILKDQQVAYGEGNKRTEYKHETLAGIAKAVDPILAEHGLSYRFRSSQGEGGIITVACIISHRGGYSEETSLSAGRDESGGKNNIQAVGSTTTYLQRYTLKLALGLAAAADDDARTADAPDPITADQLANLRREIEAADADEAAFCKWLGVDTLADLPEPRFWDAVKALNVKKAAKAKAEGGDA